MAFKSLFSDRSHPGPRNVGGKSFDLPPMWFLAGTYVGLAILVAGCCLMVDTSRWYWGSIGRLIAAVVAGAGVMLGLLGTAIEISAQAAMCRLERNLRTRRQLFGYGVAFAFCSVVLALGMWWGSGLVVDTLPLAGFRAKVVAYIAAGLASLVLSTGIVMRLFALACPRSEGEGTTGPTEGTPSS